MFCSQSVRGMEMMTPLPVPIHKRLHDTMRAVMRTNEKPSLPVPDSEIRTVRVKADVLNRGQIFGFRQAGLTQHLADVGLDVHVLEVLEGVSMEQPQSGVQPDGHPDAITVPGQLTHLAVFTRVGVE